MASPDSSTPSIQQQIKINSAYESFKHNAALTMLVLAPVLVVLPPRKLDLYTLSLAGAFVASANQLTVERTGKGLLSQFSYGGMPARAVEVQRQLAEEKDRRRLLEERSGLPDEVRRRNTGVRGAIEEKAKDIWMGGETEGWKERRLREEQEKLNQGEGYGGMIMDQIWEVWNQGEKKAEEVKEQDQRVLEEKKEDVSKR